MLNSSVCVECGKLNSKNIYREYSGGAIQLSKCDKCDCFLDKYCECDNVLLALDVLLLKLQAYRHLLYNYDITNRLMLRLSMIIVLCGAYINSRLNCPQTDKFLFLQINFHFSFLQSIIDFITMMVLSSIAIRVLETNVIRITWFHIMKAIIVTSVVKWFAVVSFIWVDGFYVRLLLSLALPVQMRSYQVIFPGCSSVAVFTVVLGQTLLLHAINVALANTKMLTITYLLEENIPS